MSTKPVCKCGRLPAPRIGGTYIINETALALVAERKVGRPPKRKDEQISAAEAVTKVEKTLVTTVEPLTPKVKARRAKQAVAAPNKALTTAEKRTTKAKEENNYE